MKPRKKQMKPHKHAAIIKEWADGAEIEYYRYSTQVWVLMEAPNWGVNTDYRVKPTPKPDIVTTRFVSAAITRDFTIKYFDNLKLTFEGETGKLKAAEVL